MFIIVVYRSLEAVPFKFGSTNRRRWAKTRNKNTTYYYDINDSQNKLYMVQNTIEVVIRVCIYIYTYITNTYIYTHSYNNI